MGKLRRCLFALAVSAFVGLIAGEVRAAPISMTIDVTGGTIPVDVFAVSTPTTYTVDAARLLSINAALAALGSEYRFISLGGSSNFPGDATQGQLVVTGEIHSVGTAGTDAFLKLTETETSFPSPPGASGTLRSSSTGNFPNEPAGGHTAVSMFNAISTPTYTVLSTGTPANPGINGGPVSVAGAPVSTLYTLTNMATFGLAHPAATAPDIVDSFGVTATVSAAVPEPASLITMLTAFPLPLVVVGLLRRRRAVA